MLIESKINVNVGKGFRYTFVWFGFSHVKSDGSSGKKSMFFEHPEVFLSEVTLKMFIPSAVGM